MKKKLRGEETHFVTLKLYKEDLDEILEIMRAADNKVTIGDDEFIYDSIEELQKRKGRVIKRLDLSNSASSLTFTMGNREVKLTRAGDIETISPYTQIKEILNKCRRKPWDTILHPYLIIPIIVSIFVAAFFSDRYLSEKATVAILTPTILMLVLSLVLHHEGIFSRIVLISKHEEQSFWIRNKDAVIVAVISAIVASALTFLVTYILFTQGIK